MLLIYLGVPREDGGQFLVLGKTLSIPSLEAKEGQAKLLTVTLQTE